MTLRSDDPRLTAYALGELDERESAQLEAELGESPDGQRALAEIRQTARLLRAALAQESAPALSHEARTQIVAAAAHASVDASANGQMPATAYAAVQLRPVSPTARRGDWWRRHRLAVAGGVLAAGALVALMLPAMQMAREETEPQLLALADQHGGHANFAGDDSGYFPPSDRGLISEEAAKGTTALNRIAQQGEVAAQVDQPRPPRGSLVTELYRGSTREGTPVAPATPVPGDKDVGYTVSKPVYETPRSGAPMQDVALQNGQPAAAAPARSESPYLRNAGSAYPQQQQGQAAKTWGMDAGQTRNYFGLALTNPQSNVDGRGQVDRLMLMVTPRVIIREEEEEVLGRRGQKFNTEAYDAIVENPFQRVSENPLSTFSIDVDTASYANLRRFLRQGSLPPAGAVRIEELINYFRYNYAGPTTNEPFAANAEVAVCPWAPEHRLVRIGLKGREIAIENRPASNLVFLVDVSGSMRDANKLPLVKEGLRLLVEKLGENDRVALVVYAGAAGLVLPSTPGTQKQQILYAIDGLEAGGSTNGGSGIQLAYDTAMANFVKGGANRVILATDGDFNVGVTDQSDLLDLIQKKAASGVFLSVLGFGMGNYKDSTLEKLADKGNGNYAYIDALAEARKVLVEQLSGTLVTIAKDVKIQIEFNPAKVQAYRLIGYENRMLAKEDFNDDRKDAGEIGAGHTVTALYEIVPAGAAAPQQPTVDKLEYQADVRPNDVPAKSADLLMLKLRYKEPDGDTSKLLKFPVADRDQTLAAAGDDFQFAAAVASFGMLLRGSAHKGTASYASVLEMARASRGDDKEGYRRELIELVEIAQRLGAK